MTASPLSAILWTDYAEPPVSAEAFANLPDLTSLEELCVQPIEAVSELVDCLVQMPTLKAVTLIKRLSEQHKDRLRNSLPRLEELTMLEFELDICVGKRRPAFWY